MYARERIVFPLDTSDIREAIAAVEKLKGVVGLFKIGLELHHAITAALVASDDEEEAYDNFKLVRKLFKVLDGNIFWDGKFDDIPNTVNNASKQVMRMRVKMYNVHASSGRESVEKAVARKGSAKVLGVTVLTSITPEECKSIFGEEPGAKVLQFAQMLIEVGADGIICSPKELKFLAEHREFDSLLKVTPGVRPFGVGVNDQKRVMTPGEAIRAGADYLVIGRPISAAEDPIYAARKIAKEIAMAFAEKRALEIFEERKAIIKGSHLVYKSKKHGHDYVNKDEVFVDPEATDELCQFIAEQYQDIDVDVVIAPVEGGINLSQGVARHLTKLLGKTVYSVYADKDGDGLVIRRGYGKYLKGKKVLVVDDVFTTGGSVKKLVDLVLLAGGIIVGIGGLCDRGNVKVVGFGEGMPELYALVTVEMIMYEPGDCPLCRDRVAINVDVGHGKEFLEEQATAS